MRLGETAHVPLIRAVEKDLQQIFTVHRKIVPNGQPSARREWQIFADDRLAESTCRPRTPERQEP
jgi:hypothetical protein